ncbi:hypothetical protein [Arenibacter sp. M-2]|uniref:hypothetical protein n=1 Tax=Arenibacter sp. M-2 TaxID=3053612 RepID=UPI0025701712|nr:hypothetical protein [Arenibacter sp. M-2]
MYISKEMRWFFKGENKYLQQWFNSLDFNSMERREDIYLNIANNNIGIKLREEKIEIKHRVNTRYRNCLTSLASGYLEDWTRWSFNSNPNDLEYLGIINGERENWITISKNRNTVYIANISDKTVVFPPDKNLDFGCQVEYSNFSLKGAQWFTFGLEWFGESLVKLNQDLVDDILGKTHLTLKQSMSYPEFLKKMDQ